MSHPTLPREGSRCGEHSCLHPLTLHPSVVSCPLPKLPLWGRERCLVGLPDLGPHVPKFRDRDGSETEPSSRGPKPAVVKGFLFYTTVDDDFGTTPGPGDVATVGLLNFETTTPLVIRRLLGDTKEDFTPGTGPRVKRKVNSALRVVEIPSAGRCTEGSVDVEGGRDHNGDVGQEPPVVSKPASESLPPFLRSCGHLCRKSVEIPDPRSYGPRGFRTDDRDGGSRRRSSSHTPSVHDVVWTPALVVSLQPRGLSLAHPTSSDSGHL